MIEGDSIVGETVCLTNDPDTCASLLTGCESAVLAFNEHQLEQFATEYFVQVPTLVDSIENEQSTQDGLW